MKTTVLSWLLHHANREYKSEHFYHVKNMLLKKYGSHAGYDLQHIEGKKCYTCGGSGIYTGYYWSGEQWHDSCNRCYGGWYKLPQYNILERVKFGNFIFHQPYKRFSKNPEGEFAGLNKIDGYVYHSYTPYGPAARHILFLLYESGYLKRYYKNAGIGWRTQWWLPGAWIPNTIHLVKYKLNSIPFIWIKDWWNKPSGYVKDVVFDYDFFVGRKQTGFYEYHNPDDMPF
jgi:hypothetical protein